MILFQGRTAQRQKVQYAFAHSAIASYGSVLARANSKGDIVLIFGIRTIYNLRISSGNAFIVPIFGEHSAIILMPEH